MNALRKLSKTGFTLSALVILLSISGVASAKAKWTAAFCVDTTGITEPYTYVLANTGSLALATSTPSVNGKFVMPSIIPNCPNYAIVTYTDGSGNWSAQGVGYSLDAPVTAMSPTLAWQGGAKTGTCNNAATLSVHFAVMSIQNNYRMFYGNNLGNIIRLHMTGSLVSHTIQCSMSQGPN